MKGDKFRAMADRCGDLPDSVMAVPGLEYVGEKSAEWEALCVRAAGWIGQGPEASRIDPYDEELALDRAMDVRLPVADRVTTKSIYGLALFARLMAIVTKDQT